MSYAQSTDGATLSSEMPAPGPMVLLTRLSRLVYRRATDDILGMSMKQYVALCQLREQVTVSQQAFCEALHLDPNNCVLLLNTLESDDLLERRRDPTDRRRHIVVLTRKGQQALERADHALESVEDDVLGALSKEERATLHRLLLRAASGAFKTRNEVAAR
jgi:MarR family transcriptional regulator, temperature-dependent positive regulator of motility